MEITLRKPQRIIFGRMKANEGCYLRSYRKSPAATRIYWRLMTKDHSPVVNIPPGLMKPLFQLSLMVEIGSGQLIEKKTRVKKR